MASESVATIFKKYAECYTAIETLHRNYIIDDDLEVDLKLDILREIIDYMKSEIEE